MTSQTKATALRHSTGERHEFDSHAEALRFCLRRGDAGELWRIEG